MTYADYPPEPYFSQVIRNCPKAAELYKQLWSNKNKHNKLFVVRKKIQIDFLTTAYMFEQNLTALTKEGLLSYFLEEKDFAIELTAWDDEFEGFGL